MIVVFYSAFFAFAGVCSSCIQLIAVGGTQKRMLQEFLNHQFVEITSDEDLTKLRKAGVEILKRIEKRPGTLAAYASVAFDPTVEADNPDIREVEDIVARQWKTFSANAKDKRITVLRAVMIEAIQKACATDIQHRCIVWLTLRNVIRFYTLGREKELLTGYLSQLANKIEDEATDKWSSGSPSDVSKVAVETSWAEPVGADAESLAKKLLTASGPTNKEGQAYAGTPNPQFPNSGGPWTYEFAPRAATAIATTINNAISRNLDGVQSGMEGFVSNVEAAVSKTLQDIVESNKFFGVRTHLLWWGEALYSRTFRKSYRDLPKGFLALGMACDYSEIMPAVYPVSGDFFLTESYRKLYEGADADKQIPIRELIEVYVANRSELRSLVTTARPPFSRISLLEFVRGLILDEFRIEDLESKVGIDPESKITEAEQVVWLFHDFQASKLTGTAR